MVMDETRQFDFWLGSWEVRNPSGELAGHNRVEALYDGLVLQEHWEGAKGGRGTSFSLFSRGRGHWHQTWVDAGGMLLLLDGGLRDGAMVLEGTTPDLEQPGRTLRHRISWSVMDGDPDQVRQHWETSADDGATWETAFDGRYRRKAG